MKNLFDINMETEEFDGNAFFTKRISAELEEKKDSVASEYLDLHHKDLKQTVSGIIAEYICLLIVVIGISIPGKIFTDSEITFKQAFARNPIVFSAIITIVIAAAIVGIYLEIRRRKKSKEYEAQIEQKNLISDIDNYALLAMEELQIPEERFDLEVLCSYYEMKNERKIKKTEWSEQFTMDVYERGNNICFFDGTQELAIPISDIKEIEFIQKKRSIPAWMKDISHKDPKYKKYKIIEEKMGYVIRGYYRLVIDSIWGQYEVIVPNYEEEAMQKIEEMRSREYVI